MMRDAQRIDHTLGFVRRCLAILDGVDEEMYLSYIKFDFYARKYLRISPDWQEELILAQANNLSPTDCEMLFDILGVERPLELDVF